MIEKLKTEMALSAEDCARHHYLVMLVCATVIYAHFDTIAIILSPTKTRRVAKGGSFFMVPFLHFNTATALLRATQVHITTITPLHCVATSATLVLRDFSPLYDVLGDIYECALIC